MNDSPVKKGDTLKIYVDGAARGNPGPAASAFLLVQDENIIYDNCEFIGTMTNNVAEYTAIQKALNAAKSIEAKRIKIGRAHV